MTAMGNTEKTELTVMCMICDGTKILVQDRVNKDWPGVTGLDIFRPTVCGINDFIRDDGTRYIVLFFRTDRFGGELKSSDEGRVFWVERDELTQYKLSHDFIDMVHVMENPSLTEFFYERDGENWKKRRTYKQRILSAAFRGRDFLSSAARRRRG